MLGKMVLLVAYLIRMRDSGLEASPTYTESRIYKVIDKISIPKFPFDGKFLLKKGVQEGKKIGIILNEAEKIWVNNNFNLSPKDFETIIKKNTI